MKEKACSASKESPLRARSAITVFQHETLLLSTYFPNMLLRFAFFVHDAVTAVECLSIPSVDIILETNELILCCCGFTHSFIHYHHGLFRIEVLEGMQI